MPSAATNASTSRSAAPGARPCRRPHRSPRPRWRRARGRRRARPRPPPPERARRRRRRGVAGPGRTCRRAGGTWWRLGLRRCCYARLRERERRPGAHIGGEAGQRRRRLQSVLGGGGSSRISTVARIGVEMGSRGVGNEGWDRWSVFSAGCGVFFWPAWGGVGVRTKKNQRKKTGQK